MQQEFSKINGNGECMTTIKPIETAYKGYRFRSRLEARWAVFFDALKVEWKYEHEGFEKPYCESEEERMWRYLPDFYLPQSKSWIEVKGSDELLLQDSKRLSHFLDYGSPLPGFDGSHLDQDGRGLLVLGEIPNPDLWGIHLHPIVRHYKGLIRNYARFSGKFWRPVEVMADQATDIIGSIIGKDIVATLDAHCCDENDHRKFWTTKSLFVPTQLSFQNVHDAYRAARSARFEHGESPRI